MSRAARLAGVRVAGGAALAVGLLLLQGCLPGLIAMQAVPAAMGGVAMGNVEDRNPFITRLRHAPPRPDDELAALDAHLRRARCGDARSQYWLGNALGNGYNTSPDRIEMYKWLRLAERGGVADAAPALARLGASMSPAQIEQARARVSRWQARSCPAPEL